MNFDKNKSNFQRGFTIVELLIVVVVIAILAAITIVSYNGISRRATESAMKSDLRNSANLLETEKATSGSYPASADVANNGQGLKVSGNNILSYTPFNGGYCVAITNTQYNQQLHIDSATGSIEANGCGVIVATLAGSTNWGYNDGTGASAQFNSPTGIALTASGDALVPDAGCGCIRRVTPSGVVTTYFTRNDIGDDAQIAIDASGNMYLAAYTGCIKKITPALVMTTLAGVCTWPSTTGTADGTGSAARFNDPQGLTIDSAGNIYVADAGNDRIRRVTPGGVVTTIAGSTDGYNDATGTAAQFSYPTGIDIDASGNLFVTDNNNKRIRKITPSREVSTVAGSGTRAIVDGTGTAAQFSFNYWLSALTVAPDGTIYVGDDGAIRKVTPDGVVTTIAGSATSGSVDGRGTDARLGNYYLNMDIDASGVLWVADQRNNSIRKISL